MAVIAENQGGDIEAKKPQRNRVASSRARAAAAAEKAAPPMVAPAATAAKEPRQKKVPATVRKERKTANKSDKNNAFADQPAFASPAVAVPTGRVYPCAG